MSKRNQTYYETLGIPSNAKHNDVGLAFNPQVYRHIANFLAAPEAYNRKRRGAA